MEEKPDMTALIHKYLTGQATTEERRFVDAWLLESDENQEMFEEIKLIWDNSEEEPIEISDSEMQEGLRHLEETIAGKIQEEQRQTIDRFNSDNYRSGRYKNIAIVVLLIIASIAILAFYVQNDLSSEEITITGKRNILLPDSTEIFSNKATSVSFRQTLWKREVHLEGEVYFDVHRNEWRPFIIHADETTIKVLGTSFLVSAYPEEPVQISVVSGSVAVLHKDRQIDIETGEEIHITGNDEIRKTGPINPNLFAWKTGKLVFNSSTVQEVLRELGQLYDVQFEIEDTDILKCPFTGKFDNLTLKEALHILSFSLHLSVDFIDNKHIQLSGKGACQ